VQQVKKGSYFGEFQELISGK